MTNCSPPLDVALGAAERRQDQRLLTVDQVRAVGLGRDVDGQPAAAQRRRGDLGVGGGGEEVAAHREEDVRTAVAHRPDRVDHVEAVLARHREAERPFEAVQQRLRRLLEDAHRAVALHVGVAAHRAHAGAGTPDVAAQQQEVDDLPDRRPPSSCAGSGPSPSRRSCAWSATASAVNRSISASRQAGRPPRPRPRRGRCRCAFSASKPSV